MQRLWDRMVPGVLEEQRGGLCVWNRVSEGGRGRRGGGEGREDLGFYPREVGALEGCGQRAGGA